MGVELVLWVEEGLSTALGGRTKIVSLPAEIVWIVVGLSVVDGANSTVDEELLESAVLESVDGVSDEDGALMMVLKVFDVVIVAIVSSTVGLIALFESDTRV